MNGKNRSASSLSIANRTVDCLHTYQCCVCFGWISNHKRNVFSRFVRAKDRTWLSAIYTVNAHCACQILIKQPLFTGRKYTNELCFRLDTLKTSLFSSCLVGMENYFTLHINTTTHSKCSGRAFFMGLKCKCNVLWCKWMYLKSAKQALFSTSFWFTFGNLHCCTALFLLSKDTK